tara:strand:- start:787 stop:1863 length:1077 start_codon:yes stop_codon:yes gene_type:complete
MTQSEIVASDAPPDEVKALVSQGSAAMRNMAERANMDTLINRQLVAEQIKTLQGTGAQWIKSASAVQVKAFVQVSHALDLNPIAGDCYLIHGGFYISMQGRRALAQRTGQMGSESDMTMLTEAEQEVHGVQPGDIARKVEVLRSTMSAPVTGVGIVRAAEVQGAQKGGMSSGGVYNLPLANMPEQMAGKRAAMAAYRKAFPEIAFGVERNEEDPMDFDVIDMPSDAPAGVNTDTGEMADPEPVGVAPADAPSPEPAATGNDDTEMTAAEYLTKAVATIVWGAYDPDQTYAIENVLGCTATEWLEATFTMVDAGAIALAVQASMAEGKNMVDAVSAVHWSRSNEGLPFMPAAVKSDTDA